VTAALSGFLKELAKAFVFKHTPFGRPNYPYHNVEPIELAALVNEIERLRGIKGNIVEVGVARGMTTRFVCEHIVTQGLQDTLTLYAVDTFSSFTDTDLKYEVATRGKKLSELKAFAYNDYAVWRKNFASYPFVQTVRADCNTVDYSRFSPVKLAFVDVDLYVPTKSSLRGIFDVTVPGGGDPGGRRTRESSL
jgi:Macrocin-O-methyltransferase (TylF)